MSDFKRELRYFIFKTKHLTQEQREQLLGIADSINHPPLECVVVESDWPNYEDTWKSIEQVANGEYQSPYDLIEQQQKRIAELEAKTSCCMGVGNGNGRLFVYGDHESIKTAQRYVLERDELAATVERLRDALNQSLISWGYVGVPNEEGETYKECEKRLEQTPQQNLNAVKREAWIKGYQSTDGTYHGENTEYMSIVRLANQRYPSVKDGE